MLEGFCIHLEKCVWCKLTSFLVTGFSSSVKCVSFVRFLSGSRSASSATLFAVRTRVDRFGIEVAMEGWMCETRLRARSKVRRRGENGKFERDEMLLSVKSIASWPYSAIESI